MGYTHYYEAKRSFTDDEWKKIMEFSKKVIGKAKERDIKIDPCGNATIPVSETAISLNGDLEHPDDLGHETFYLPKEKDRWSFCKTARKPYDLVVTTILWYLLEEYPEVMGETGSDGDMEGNDYPEEWNPAKELYKEIMEEK